MPQIFQKSPIGLIQYPKNLAILYASIGSGRKSTGSKSKINFLNRKTFQTILQACNRNKGKQLSTLYIFIEIRVQEIKHYFQFMLKERILKGDYLVIKMLKLDI